VEPDRSVLSSDTASSAHCRQKARRRVANVADEHGSGHRCGIREMSAANADAFFVSASSLSRSHRNQLAELALKYRLPSMFGIRENVEAGGLMSYAPNPLDLMRRAATYVDKILNGARPADLPVEQASQFELVLNLKTAKALGLTIPDKLLVAADVIE